MVVTELEGGFFEMWRYQHAIFMYAICSGRIRKAPQSDFR